MLPSATDDKDSEDTIFEEDLFDEQSESDTELEQDAVVLSEKLLKPKGANINRLQKADERTLMGIAKEKDNGTLVVDAGKLTYHSLFTLIYLDVLVHRKARIHYLAIQYVLFWREIVQRLAV